MVLKHQQPFANIMIKHFRYLLMIECRGFTIVWAYGICHVNSWTHFTPTPNILHLFWWMNILTPKLTTIVCINSNIPSFLAKNGWRLAQRLLRRRGSGPEEQRAGCLADGMGQAAGRSEEDVGILSGKKCWNGLKPWVKMTGENGCFFFCGQLSFGKVEIRFFVSKWQTKTMGARKKEYAWIWAHALKPVVSIWGDGVVAQKTKRNCSYTFLLMVTIWTSIWGKTKQDPDMLGQIFDIGEDDDAMMTLAFFG